MYRITSPDYNIFYYIFQVTYR